MSEVLAIIPARSGSKSVIDKNIRALNGVPLLAYSIRHALKSKCVDRVIVSTDSEEYAEVAREYGAEVPFLRPAGISGDRSLDIEVFEHALKWLEENEDYRPDICVHLRPTHPVRERGDIDKMVALLEANPQADAVRSVSPAQQTPYKMWQFEGDTIKPIISCDVPEAYNAPRQALPETYMQNACIDIMRASTILNKHSMTGDVIMGYKMGYDFDIDTEAEFLRTEQYIALKCALESKAKLQVCCDIDGVIASKTPGNDYSTARPIWPNIALVNRMYDAGHEILLYTARGTMTGIDWAERTEKQMADWGVKHHCLQFGKPAADIYIDDRFFSLETLEQVFGGESK